MTRTIFVSNRLPWSIAIKEDQAALQATSGGLATALAGPHGDGESCWVGWPGELSGLSVPERVRILGELRARRFVPVDLTHEEVKRYYEGFSNGVLWPLFHYLLDKVRLDADLDWDAYESVNERFAAAIAETAENGDSVWVHDYQLMLVPRILRELRPDLRIGFFLHIPFPAQEVFRILPWAEALLQGLLSADLIGFHTRDYRDHFAACANQMLGAEPAPNGIHYQGRVVRLKGYAIGIDAEAFAKLAGSQDVIVRTQKIREEVEGRRILLGIDRMDYTKGIPRRLMAFERYLESHPAMRDKVLFLQVAAPSRQGVEAYATFRKQVDEIAGRINGLYGSPSRVPIHLLYQPYPFEELVALYCAADVMLVTPLRDGMNLVAKEFCAARNDHAGVLVLSEFAGAAAELNEALQVNPYDIGAVAAAIDRALALEPSEVALRMKALRRRVFRGNVHRWAKAFLADLEELSVEAEPSVYSALLQRIAHEASCAQSIELMLDYDGTLVPFVETPEDATPDDDLLRLFKQLAAIPSLRLHLVSGRSRDVMEAWFAGLPLALHAEHGFWHKASADSSWCAARPPASEWRPEVNQLLETWRERHPGSRIEQKDSSVAWHFRQVSRGLNRHGLRHLQEEAAPLLQCHGLEILAGQKVLEFRLKGVQKGMAVTAEMRKEGSLVIAIGDDQTDEDLFRALPPTGISIRVGQGPSEANARISDLYLVRRLLTDLATRLSAPVPA